MDYSPPGSSVHGILPARILEWVAIPSSRESSWPGDQILISCISCFGRDILYHWATWEANLRIEWAQMIIDFLLCASSVQFSCSVMSDSLQPHESQHARPLCPSPTSGVYPNSCPLSRWCHPTIPSSVIPISSCPHPFPGSGSFQMSQLFASGGQSIGVSASTSVLLMNTQDWYLLGWAGWISLQSKGLSRVLSKTTVQKYQFFGPQSSLWSNSHIHTWLLENHSFD